MGSQFVRELRAQRARTVELIRAAAADGDECLMTALKGRLADLADIADRHGLPA